MPKPFWCMMVLLGATGGYLNGMASLPHPRKSEIIKTDLCITAVDKNGAEFIPSCFPVDFPKGGAGFRIYLPETGK
jgi:hypothetical protein